jgi:Protein of unknown function (DUF2975)
MKMPDSTNRLRRLCMIMKAITTVGIGMIALAMIAVFFIPDWTRNFLLAHLGQAGTDLPLTPGRITAAALITAIPVGVMLYGLWQARLLFADFADGQLFTLTNARRLRDFAASVLAQAVLGPLSSTALLLAFTLHNGPGERHLAIALSSNDYIALIIGGVLLAVAWVMVEATRVADENASFV